MLTKLIVCFIAGIGAGLGTGVAGMSAGGGDKPDADYLLAYPRL